MAMTPPTDLLPQNVTFIFNSDLALSITSNSSNNNNNSNYNNDSRHNNTEDDFRYGYASLSDPFEATMAAIQLLLCITIFVGNALTQFTINTVCSLRKNIQNRYIISLAVADQLVGTCILHLLCYTYFNDGESLQRWMLCRGFLALLYTSLAVSLFSMLTIAIDRYVYIVHPFVHMRHVTSKRINVLIVGQWILALTYGFVPVFALDDGPVEGCNPFYVFQREFVLYTHPIHFFVDCIGIGITYGMIARVAKSHHDRKQKRVQQVKAFLAKNTGPQTSGEPVKTDQQEDVQSQNARLEARVPTEPFDKNEGENGSSVLGQKRLQGQVEKNLKKIDGKGTLEVLEEVLADSAGKVHASDTSNKDFGCRHRNGIVGGIQEFCEKGEAKMKQNDHCENDSKDTERVSRKGDACCVGRQNENGSAGMMQMAEIMSPGRNSTDVLVDLITKTGVGPNIQMNEAFPAEWQEKSRSDTNEMGNEIQDDAKHANGVKGNIKNKDPSQTVQQRQQLQQQQQQQQQQQTQQSNPFSLASLRWMKQMVVVFGLFVILWTPSMISLLISPVYQLGHRSIYILAMFGLSNSAVNFFVYSFHNKHYRNALKKFLLCQCRKRDRPNSSSSE